MVLYRQSRGARLKALRLNYGYTLDQAAEKLNLNPYELKQLEDASRNTLSYPTLEALTKLYGFHSEFNLLRYIATGNTWRADGDNPTYELAVSKKAI